MFKIKRRRGPKPRFDQQRLDEIMRERGCRKPWAYHLLRQEMESVKMPGHLEQLKADPKSVAYVEARKKLTEAKKLGDAAAIAACEAEVREAKRVLTGK